MSAIPERFKECTFASYKPRDRRREQGLSLMRDNPGGSGYLTGAYGNGKTHLLYAQYRELVAAGKIHCHVRTTRQLVEELRRAELDAGGRPADAGEPGSQSAARFVSDGRGQPGQ